MSEITVRREIADMTDDTFRKTVLSIISDIMTVVDKGTDAEIRRSADGTYRVYELKRSRIK